ncbi:helicase associated domain-containing protein, partial [Streptomyces sp. NPDC101150]|uniref:helicase associated domain-containing protein n=1 Tax=Streptomyces sp. NPDC101150 TaxID=3366114 RepID=UPI00382DAD95
LQAIGVTPLPPEQETPAKTPKTTLGPFERGITALTQYKNRTGSVTVPRGHEERLEDGTEVKLGVWITNTKTRRNKLTGDRKAVLADLGLEWA